MKQLALELASPPAPTLDNFVVGANAEVTAALRMLVLGKGGERFVYLWGAAGSGRTHLLRATLHALQAAGKTVHAGLDAVGADDVLGVDDVEQLDAQGQVTVQTGPVVDSMVMVTITDSGPGLRVDIPRSIFEPFFTTKPQGLGMGLAISRSIIERVRAGSADISAPRKTPVSVAFFCMMADTVGGRVSRPALPTHETRPR